MHWRRCGYYGDATRECRCTEAEIQRYLGKISGPLLDRIDLHVEVSAIPSQELRGRESGMTSTHMRKRVLAARAHDRILKAADKILIQPRSIPRLEGYCE
ncbi:MAG: ATP-binding protein [Acidobacteria bacterium]|nr:ATP-binding protein [Acidobacteriota bacterium]